MLMIWKERWYPFYGNWELNKVSYSQGIYRLFLIRSQQSLPIHLKILCGVYYHGLTSPGDGLLLPSLPSCSATLRNRAQSNSYCPFPTRWVLFPAACLVCDMRAFSMVKKERGQSGGGRYRWVVCGEQEFSNLELRQPGPAAWALVQLSFYQTAFSLHFHDLPQPSFGAVWEDRNSCAR